MPFFKSSYFGNNAIIQRISNTIINKLQTFSMGRSLIVLFSSQESRNGKEPENPEFLLSCYADSDVIEPNLSQLPPHVLDIIVAYLDTKQIIVLGQVNFALYNYTQKLSRHRKIEREQVHIVRNKFYSVSFDVKDKVYLLDGEDQIKWMRPKMLFYWNSTVLRTLTYPASFLENICYLGISEDGIDDMIRFLPMIPKLGGLHIKSKSVSEDDVIRIIEAVKFNDQEEFRLSVNPMVALTPEIVEKYLEVTRNLRLRGLAVCTCANKDQPYTPPKTLAGLLHFFESTTMKRVEGDGQNSYAGYVMFDQLDRGTSNFVANLLKRRYPDDTIVTRRAGKIVTLQNWELGRRFFFVRRFVKYTF